jgi:CheY-like chemotaxis protein
VDDNAAVRRLISKIVGLRQEEVGECADGSLALSLYEVHRPDLIFMDICLAGTDGITATKQIKAAYPDARIVIVTNYDDDALRREAFLAGASDYVLKERLLHLRGVAEKSLSGMQHLPTEDHSGGA